MSTNRDSRERLARGGVVSPVAGTLGIISDHNPAIKKKCPKHGFVISK